MKIFVLFLCIIALSGCTKNAEKDLAKCRLEALTKLKIEFLGEKEAEQGYYIENCMVSNGYKFDLLYSKCSFKSEFNINCYR